MTAALIHNQEVSRLTLRKEPVGLLAGWGRFPIHFAEKAKSLGIPVVCLGIRDAASEELKGIVSRFHWTGVAQLGRMIRLFKREGVRQMVMAGKVQKTAMHSPFRFLRLLPDLRFVQFWFFRSRKNNSDDSILLGVINEFARDGIEVVSALDLCPELLMKPGIFTKRKLSEAEKVDIRIGWELAKEMGRLDVGQSVSVKEKAVLAVEAIEGTDRAILRAGELCRSGGFVVVKVAKPQQDMRFDVPTIGVNTIETMKKAGARVLVIEAEKTIVMDPEQTVQLADKLGISILSLKGDELSL